MALTPLTETTMEVLRTTHNYRTVHTHLLKIALPLVLVYGAPLCAQPSDNSAPVEPVAPAVSSSQASLDALPVEDDAPINIEDYYLEIRRLETEQGAWGDGLSEQLSGLGGALQLRGQHREAIEVLERAIHVQRINSGLYDLSQVPLVEQVIESEAALGDSSAVYERNQYLFWLYKRSYGENDLRMLPVLDKVGNSFLTDYALNPNVEPGRLIDAHAIFTKATDIIEDNYGEADLRLVAPLRGLVASNWFFATYRGAGYSSPLERQTSARNGVDDVRFYNTDAPQQLSRYLQNNFGEGQKAISEIVDIYNHNPEAPPGAAAGAKVELADWNLLFGRWQTATALYEEAYQSLSESADTQTLVTKTFGRPVALPDLSLTEFGGQDSDEPEDVKEVEDQAYVLLRYDVTRFGETSNVEILDSYPERNINNRVKAKRALQTTRFRPRMEDGQAVETTGLVHRYIFTDR